MKTKQLIKYSAALLGSAVLLTGCIEETFPENGYATSGQIAESPFAAEGVLTSMPTILMTNYTGTLDEHVDFGYAGIFGALDRLAGEVFPVAGNLPGGNQYYDRWQWVLYPCNSTGLDVNGSGSPFLYYNYYQFIYTANEAISIFSQNETPGPELGIAKAFRALSYLDMARLYDPLPAKASGREDCNDYVIPDNIKGLTVPIVREGMTREELENNPRVPREEMFEFILGDLNEAEKLLADYDRPKDKMGMPNLAVVYGLKARAYLWLGGFSESYANVPTGEAAYRLAAEFARKAIDASGCTIMTESQWLDPVTGFNKVNSAWMWALCQSVDTVINNLYSWTAHMAPEAIWGYGNGSQPGISVFSYNRMDASDFRRKQIVNADRSYAALAPYTVLTENEFEGKDGAMAVMAPYAVFKFHPNAGEKRNYSVGNVTDIPLMRVEEMYFIEAEATAHYDEGKGRTLLADFMAHRAPSYVLPVKDLVEEIIFQKRIEFWGEGIILYDLKRLDIGMQNGNEGTNAPSMAQITTNGRAPWWNCVIPLSAVQQNAALAGMNNPNATKTYKSVK